MSCVPSEAQIKMNHPVTLVHDIEPHNTILRSEKGMIQATCSDGGSAHPIPHQKPRARMNSRAELELSVQTMDLWASLTGTWSAFLPAVCRCLQAAAQQSDH